jgi:hypothetical protein
MDKQAKYERLLNEHRVVSNQIAEIKGQSFELNEQQKLEIKKLEYKLIGLMEQMKKLF